MAMSKKHKQGCMYCHTKVRLEDFHCLGKGSHICFAGSKGRMFGFGRQGYLYKHHAIVLGIDEIISNTKAVLTLVHCYTDKYDPALKVRETKEKLDLAYNEIYLVQYRHHPFSPDEICSRAKEGEKQNKRYWLHSYNCEHFAVWCVIGNETSFQVDEWINFIGKTVLGSLSYRFPKTVSILKDLLRLFSDEVVYTVKKGFAQSMPLEVVVVGMYLIYCLTVQYCLNVKFDNNTICKCCYWRQTWDMWLHFLLFLFMFGGSLKVYLMLIPHCCGIAGIVLLVLLNLCSLAVSWAVPKIVNFLRISHLESKRTEVLRELLPGDIISMRYWGFFHTCVVTSVQCNDTNSKKGRIKVVHYGLPGLLATRTIMEEEWQVNLERQQVFRYDFSNIATFEPAKVVERAKKRKGEQKFNFFTNRSCHVAIWAKQYTCLDHSATDPSTVDRSAMASLDDHFELLPNEVKSSYLLGSDWIKIHDELQTGQMVSLIKNGWFMSELKGICTDIHVPNEESPQSIQLKIVHLGKGCIEETTKHVDLRQSDVWAYRHHPAHRYSLDTIVKRAKNKIGKKAKQFDPEKECILIEKEETITNLEMLQEGDIVVFSWIVGTDHYAILKQTKHKAGDGTRGTIEVIHYSSESLFGGFEIKEDNIEFDLTRQSLKRVCFSETETFSGNETVKRAMLRIGEKKFSPFTNRSFDLVFWAKLRTDDHSNRLKGKHSTGEFNSDDQKNSLKFVKDWARCWEEIPEGSIVDWRESSVKTSGILLEKYPEKSQMEVVVSETEKLVTRLVSIDLKIDDIWIRFPDPTKSADPKEVKQRALDAVNNNKSVGNFPVCLLVKSLGGK